MLKRDSLPASIVTLVVALTAVLIPYATGPFRGAIETIRELTLEAKQFQGQAGIFIPNQNDKWRDYRRTEQSLMHWQSHFRVLERRITRLSRVLGVGKGNDELQLDVIETAPNFTNNHLSTLSDPDLSTLPPKSGAESGSPGHSSRAREAAIADRRRRWHKTLDKAETYYHDSNKNAPSARKGSEYSADCQSSGHDGAGTPNSQPSVGPSRGSHMRGSTTTEGGFISSRRQFFAGTDQALDLAVATAPESGPQPRSVPSPFTRMLQQLGMASIADLAVLAFVALYASVVVLAYVTKSALFSAVAFALSVLLLCMLYEVKLLADALDSAIDQLRIAEVQVAGIFSSMDEKEMVSQQLCLRKLAVIASFWEDHFLAIRLTLPGVGQLMLNISLLMSIAIPTTAALGQLMVRGILRRASPLT